MDRQMKLKAARTRRHHNVLQNYQSSRIILQHVSKLTDDMLDDHFDCP